jgi:hypothetical protein
MPASKNFDLFAIFSWAAVTLIAVALSDNQGLRLALALPLLLVFVGHAVLRALGPVATSLAEHTVCAVGASIAVALAGGFLLNRLGMLIPLGWALYLLTVVGLSASISLWRDQPRAVYSVALRLPYIRLRHMAMIGLAAAIMCGAYWLAVRDAASQQEFKFVDFWIVGGVGTPGALVVGIKSAEQDPKVFDIEVTRANQVIAVWRSIPLAPGQTWTRALRLSVDTQRAEKIYARLYGHDDGKLHRQVSAIVPSS